MTGDGWEMNFCNFYSHHDKGHEQIECMGLADGLDVMRHETSKNIGVHLS